MELILRQIKTIPIIRAGDNVAEIILKVIEKQNIRIANDDILVITSKIVSKAENRFVSLKEIQPSERAFRLAEICKKDARLVEIILSESKSVIRCVKDTLIVEHRLGFICANAGVDHSNVGLNIKKGSKTYLLLPKNPDASAKMIQEYFRIHKNVKIGVMIIDSHGRAWRKGVVGLMIGTAGVPALIDMRGNQDMFGTKLRITQIAAADELAASASLMMGQAAESVPAIHVRGFPYQLRDSKFTEILRPERKDLFR